jgi:hypothetical protein
MNARFWAWWNNGLVKVTLRPGQTVTVCAGTGRESRVHRFHFDGISVGFRVAAFDEHGSYRMDAVCPLADLAGTAADPEKGRPPLPRWRPDGYRAGC